MNHPKHSDHPMIKRYERKPFECSGCKEQGIGVRYQCKNNCPFVLHKVCFEARPEDSLITHPLTDKCRFRFLWKPWGGSDHRLCVACGSYVRGFVYHDISERSLDLHPGCMKLKRNRSDIDPGINLALKDKMPSRCAKCEKWLPDRLKLWKLSPPWRKGINASTKSRGWSYVSSCGKYCYHVRCVKKLLLDKRGKDNSKVGSSFLSSTGRNGSSRSFSTRRVIKAGAGIGVSVVASILLGNPSPLVLAAVGCLWE